MAKIDDSLNITINIRWLVQIVILISIIVGTWYQAQMKMAENHRHIEMIEKDLTDLRSRIGIIEVKRTEKLEEENKTLIERINIFKKDQ